MPRSQWEGDNLCRGAGFGDLPRGRERMSFGKVESAAGYSRD